MNFDDILPIIIFIFYTIYTIASAMLKKKKKSEKKVPPVPAPEQSVRKSHSHRRLFKKPVGKAGFMFSRIVNNIKAELEKSVSSKIQKERIKAAPGGNNIWEELRESEMPLASAPDPPHEIYENIDKVLPLDNVTPTPDDIEAAFNTDELSFEPTQPRENISSAHGTETSLVRNRRKRLNFSAAGMKKAVILSEILARPLGLEE